MLSRKNPILILLGLSFVFFLVFLGVSSYLFKSDSPENEELSGAASAVKLFRGGDAGVGVLEIKGVILESKKTLKTIKQFEQNDKIKAVVLRIDSPGGAVAPSQEIYQALKKLEKPVVASMASVAASGGYYIACSAEKLLANAGSITGSIGVRMDFVNLKQLYQWAKIERYSITGGSMKDAGADYKKMTPKERHMFQAMIDSVHDEFKEKVAECRKMKMAQIDRLGDGQVFSGSQALEANLVDQIGTFNDAIALAGELGKIEGEPKVYFPRRPKQKFLEFLVDQAGEDAGPGSSLFSVKQLVLRWLGLDPFFGTSSLTGEASEGGANLHHFHTPQLLWLWDGTP